MQGQSMFEGREIGGHEEKKLYIELFDNENKYEGLIVNPEHLRENPPINRPNNCYTEDERRIAVDFYIDFLHKKPRQRLEILTEMGPAELARVLKDEHTIEFEYGNCLEHVLVYFKATPFQIEGLKKRLTKTPEKYLKSEDKKYFG